MNAAEISRESGTYIVILRSDARRTIRVGARGPVKLQHGWYLYAGSALGPGGLRARLGRHLSGTGHTRWHIDYVRRATDPCAAWLCVGTKRAEHGWATALACMPDMEPVAPGLGASDCKCATHLFYTQAEPNIADFNSSLRRMGLPANVRPLKQAATSERYADESTDK